jgi:acyl carrier protein
VTNSAVHAFVVPVPNAHIDKKRQFTYNFFNRQDGCILPKMEFSLDKKVIFLKVKELLVSEFDIDTDSISLDKKLDEDFDLDSLDMVDLVLALSDSLNAKIDPSLFKNAYTVQDLVDAVQPLWK